MLGKHAEAAAEVASLRGYKLRFTTPSSVCSYCIGETRIGEEYQNGMLRKMEFP